MSSTTPLSTGTLPGAVIPPASSRLHEAHARVAAFTQQVFSAPAVLTHERDPDEGFEYVRVRVEAAGSREELKERFRRWHHELPAAAGEFSDRYCLSLALSLAE